MTFHREVFISLTTSDILSNPAPPDRKLKAASHIFRESDPTQVFGEFESLPAVVML